MGIIYHWGTGDRIASRHWLLAGCREVAGLSMDWGVVLFQHSYRDLIGGRDARDPGAIRLMLFYIFGFLFGEKEQAC